MNGTEPKPPRVKTDDPQIVLEGILKKGEHNDVIVIHIPILLFELICIVVVPLEGEDRAPVYIKHKLARRV